MKRQAIIIILILCMIPLSGCGINLAGPDTSLPENEGVLIRRDAEGLVEIHIKDGSAEISFELTQWDKLHDIYAVDPELYDIGLVREGPFAIEGCGGQIKDACIGKVAALDAWMPIGQIRPVVLLLIEDGMLEYFIADPYPGDYEWAFHSFGQLPWLNDIVSVTYEKTNEGIGDEMTFYATDKNGLRIDVRTFCCLTSIFGAEWIYEIGPAGDDDTTCIFLSFREDGKLSARKGLLNMGDCYAFYGGKYTVELDGINPILGIELWDEWKLDMSNPDFSSPPELSGKYQFEADGVYLTLYLSEGDTLEYGVALYPFWQRYR